MLFYFLKRFNDFSAALAIFVTSTLPFIPTLDLSLLSTDANSRYVDGWRIVLAILLSSHLFYRVTSGIVYHSSQFERRRHFFVSTLRTLYFTKYQRQRSRWLKNALSTFPFSFSVMLNLISNLFVTFQHCSVLYALHLTNINGRSRWLKKALMILLFSLLGSVATPQPSYFGFMHNFSSRISTYHSYLTNVNREYVNVWSIYISFTASFFFLSLSLLQSCLPRVFIFHTSGSLFISSLFSTQI